MSPVTLTRMRADARRAQIVMVARKLFARSGYRSTTTRDLATAAGISDALMYRYFEGKDDILRAVIDQGIAAFTAMGPSGASSAQLPLTERLVDLGRRFLATVSDQRDLLVLLIAEHQLLSGDSRFVTFVDLAASGLGAELADRAQAGEIRSDLNGYLFARSFMGALVAFVLLQTVLDLDDVRSVDPDIYLVNLVETFVKGAQP
jgi:AcrR family transcriptional regulator